MRQQQWCRSKAAAHSFWHNLMDSPHCMTLHEPVVKGSAWTECTPWPSQKPSIQTICKDHLPGGSSSPLPTHILPLDAIDNMRCRRTATCGSWRHATLEMIETRLSEMKNIFLLIKGNTWVHHPHGTEDGISRGGSTPSFACSLSLGSVGFPA